jgi:transketolase
MTTLSNSGHPGGSFSSIDLYLTVYSCANIYPEDPYNPARDRIIVSHGHTSPGVYAALANVGFFSREEAVSKFRKTGSLFEGHVERTLSGVEWSSGNLGQGLAAGCGFAIASRQLRRPFHVFVMMSDAEQAKGQVAEARRIAGKFDLSDITVVIDYNKIQLSGPLNEIMPQNIKENYLADGWKTLEIDGHDYQQIYGALREAVQAKEPTAILASTVMGKNISFMENRHEYHGKALSEEEYQKAMDELGLDPDLALYREKRERVEVISGIHELPYAIINIDVGESRTYEPNEKTDNRSAFGRALKDIAIRNSGQLGKTPLAVFDCDLVGSVKTDSFAEGYPGDFFQDGVQEHSTATAAGACSSQGVQVFFADFGVFAVDEVYNQQRLNDINQANLKVIATHVGLNVGEDGKTHQCIDYLGLTRSLPGFKTIVPADPNQTDRVIRYVASQPGNYLVAMGRSKLPVITAEDGEPLFGGNYYYLYGKVDRVRRGSQAAILSYGSLLGRALEAWEELDRKGISVALYNFSCPNHLEMDILQEAADTGAIITYEDHLISTGLASTVALALAEQGWQARFNALGVKDYALSGAYQEVYDAAGLKVSDLVETVEKICSQETA